MNAVSEGKNVVLLGATGMVGGEALGLLLEEPAVERVTVIGRRPTGIAHEKLREIIHEDFEEFSSLSDVLEGQDAALFCLGAYTGAVPDEQFRRITYDITVAFAGVLRAASPGAAMCFLSGAGADRSGKSRMAFARYKGMAENALIEAGFPRLHIFRPGYIYPVTPRKEPNLVYRISRTLWPVLRVVAAGMGISSVDLARAMVTGGLEGTGDHDDPVLENRDIRTMVAR